MVDWATVGVSVGSIGVLVLWQRWMVWRELEDWMREKEPPVWMARKVVMHRESVTGGTKSATGGTGGVETPKGIDAETKTGTTGFTPGGVSWTVKE